MTTTTPRCDSTTAAAIRQLILREMTRLDPVHDKTDEAIDNAYGNVLVWLDAMAETSSLESRLVGMVEAYAAKLEDEEQSQMSAAARVAGYGDFERAAALKNAAVGTRAAQRELRALMACHDVPATVVGGELKITMKPHVF